MINTYKLTVCFNDRPTSRLVGEMSRDNRRKTTDGHHLLLQGRKRRKRSWHTSRAGHDGKPDLVQGFP
jgi:hypothetical protein